MINTNLEENFWDELEFEQKKRKNLNEVLKSGNKAQKELLSMFNKSDVSRPKEGTTLKGTYIGVLSDHHCFDVPGLKDYVRVENRPLENKYLRNSNIGDVVELMIIYVNEQNFFIHGSLSSIYETKARESLLSLEENLIVNSFVRNTTPAGYDIDIFFDGVTLPGFMPNTLAGVNKLSDTESIVGQEMLVMIESFSESEGTYIVSRRKYLQTLIPEAIKSLSTDVVYTGVVTGTKNFGVFVEFNECLTGMIHKANIQEDWQNRIDEILPGMEIDFYVKEIIEHKEPTKNKIILTQIFRETLWDTIHPGQIITGLVRDNKKFGTLVSLDDETNGLIHISELEKLKKKFDVNEKISVKVLAVDRQNRKIFLTVYEK
jgi:ribosomal protein S1